MRNDLRAQAGAGAVLLAGLIGADTFVIVTHDQSLSSRADRVIRMEDGRIAS